jgi:ribosomal protein S18 acetylase RimI-like enzyme
MPGTRRRLWMRLDLTTPVSAVTRALATVDGWTADTLAPLLLASYRGSVDDEGEDLEGATGEVERTLTGVYGPLLADASFVAVDGDRPVGAVLVTLWEERPLIAHVVVDPAVKRVGLGTDLMNAAANALAAAGRTELDLFVTEANEPAVRLYRSLGYRALRRITSSPSEADP